MQEIFWVVYLSSGRVIDEARTVDAGGHSKAAAGGNAVELGRGHLAQADILGDRHQVAVQALRAAR